MIRPQPPREKRAEAGLPAGVSRSDGSGPSYGGQPSPDRRAKAGAEDWNRTSDTSIFSAVLYRLSYLGTAKNRVCRIPIIADPRSVFPRSPVLFLPTRVRAN